MISTHTANTYLQSHNDSLQIQHWLPVLPQDVQAHITLQVNIRVVNLLRALDLRRLVREALTNRKREVEPASLVHALIRLDRKREVQRVVWIWEIRLHGRGEIKLGEICVERVGVSMTG